MPFDIYDFTSLTQWIDTSLNDRLSPFWAVVAEMAIVGLLILVFYALIGLFLVYAERKVCAFMQNRLGPNRVGPFGIFQTVADLIKLLLVELVPIRNADKFLFNVAPFIVIIASFMAISRAISRAIARSVFLGGSHLQFRLSRRAALWWQHARSQCIKPASMRDSPCPRLSRISPGRTSR